MNFYEGKIGYSHLRWLYTNLSKRPLLNFLMHSGMLDIENDIGKDEEYVKTVVTFYKNLPSYLLKNSLPPEREFLTNNSYKTYDLNKDLRIYLRNLPTAKPLLTILDFNGLLGSNTLRYSVNRLFFAPIEETPSRDEIVADLQSLSYNMDIGEEDVEQEVKSLQKELNYKSQVINAVIEKNKKDINQTQISNQKTKDNLRKRIDFIDKNTMKAFGELDELFSKELKKNEEDIDIMIKEFQEKQEIRNKSLQDYKLSFKRTIQEIVNKVDKIKPVSDTQDLESLKKDLELLNMKLSENLLSRTTMEKLLDEYDVAFHKMSRLFSNYKESDLNLKGIDSSTLNKYFEDIEKSLTGNMKKYNSLVDIVNKEVTDNVRIIARRACKLEEEMKNTTENSISLNKFSKAFVKGEKENETN